LPSGYSFTFGGLATIRNTFALCYFFILMTTTLHLTPATVADIPALVTLVNSAYRGESSRQGWTTEADLLGGTRIDEASLRELLADPGAVVLKCLTADGALLGSVYLSQHDERLYLGMLTVRPDQQARGVGKHLLAAAEAHARQLGCRVLEITVLSARPELLAWYERHGYRRTGATEPFPEGPQYGIPREPLTLLVLEKVVG
jgi:ribosomal protein S18 acetylase RimI-like enzyme